MQRILTSYCQSGGHLLVSGAYVGSDMDSSQGNKEFIQNILKYRHGNSLKTDGDKIAVRGLGHTFTLPRLPNEQSYPVTSRLHPAHVSRFSSHDLCHQQHTRRRSLSRQ